ncbi:MAG: DUF58 domain-containing protein [Coriobacteriia bacterium]
MSRSADTPASQSRLPYVAPRAALLLGLPPALLVFVASWWAWLVALAWVVLAAWVVWYDHSRAVDPEQVVARRTLPERFSIGVLNSVTLEVTNTSDSPCSLLLRETPPAGFSGPVVFGPLDLSPKETQALTFELTPPSRGEFRFGPVAVRSLGPLGFAGRQGETGRPQTARVYPDIRAVHQYALLARKGMLYELGIRQARLAGRGTEFESLRDYLPGDTYRDVDWKATARRGRPVVRTYEVERSQTLVLAVDAGRMMTPVVGGMSKLDRAVNAALLLAYLGMEMDDLVGLLVFSRDIQAYLPPRKGRRQFAAILESLYSVEGRVEEPDYPRALRYLASRLGKRSLVVLWTDLVGTDPSKRLLGVLKTLSPRHLPLVVTQRNRHLEQTAAGVPESEADVFAAAVAEGVLRDKAAAIRTLTASGALALDVFPEELSVATVNRYLSIKARGLL